MESALDPELIRLAMGQHANLPIPEELCGLLADAELALLVRRPEISEELIQIGWYLHAVASSRYALQTYGIERQRAAFKVAGHIFDLLLQCREVTWVDRLKYCFASQIAYLRSELDPNALAMYHREVASELANPSLIEKPEEVALSCGVSLLGLDVGYVYKAVNELRDEVHRLVARWEVEDIFCTPFEAAAGVASGTRDLMAFLVHGREDLLGRSLETLKEAVISDPSAGDQISRWVAAHLLNLGHDLEKVSIWTVLPPEVPSSVKRAFAMGSPRVLTLWPPQLKLFATKGINPFSTEVKRLFLSTPTSGGKTLLAQLLVVSHLATERTSVCYVAPTRSLCREVRKSLESRLRFAGKEIASGLPEGDWLDDILDLGPQVEVMTPERLSYLIRSDSDRVLEQFGMFIFDEVHLVGEPDRGWVLEQDLAYLHYATRDRTHRIVLMSAAVGNRNHFIQWMKQDEGEVLYHDSPWRGPRRLHAVWTTEPDWASFKEEAIRSKKFPFRTIYPLYGKLYALISHTGRFHSLKKIEPIGELALKSGPGIKKERDTNRTTAFYRMVVPIIQHLSESGPVLVIESTRPRTVWMAKEFADAQDTIERPEIQALVDLVKIRLGSMHPLCKVLKKGVAYHHGSLPSEIRESIEEAVSHGYVKCLVATTTMTEGVNLPVRSVVIASQGSYTDEGYVEYITGPKLINAIVRAARATKETEGVVVLACNRKIKPADFERLRPDDSDLHITSMLATEKALKALSDFEQDLRVTEDAVFETAVKEVSGFLAFIWFIAAELEKLEQLPCQNSICEVLEHTLAWLQLSPEDRNRWLSIVNPLLSRYNVTNPSTRRRWAASGTSLHSARVIEDIARDIADILMSIEAPQDPIDAVCLIIDDGRLSRILELHEAPNKGFFRRRRGPKREEMDIPVDELLCQWLQGTELVELANTYFSTVDDMDFRFEQLSDFINDYFEVFLPWIFGSIVSWTNEILEENDSANFLPKTIPANIRWGVANSTALKLVIRGIQSRTLASKMAKAWESNGEEGNIYSWVRSMTLEEWQQTFDASVAELRTLLDFSRDRRGGVAVELITEGVAELEVESNIMDMSQEDASLEPTGTSELSSINIQVENQVVGSIPSRYQADIWSILRAGLVFSAKFSAWSGRGFVELRLVDPGI